MGAGDKEDKDTKMPKQCFGDATEGGKLHPYNGVFSGKTTREALVERNKNLHRRPCEELSPYPEKSIELVSSFINDRNFPEV